MIARDKVLKPTGTTTWHSSPQEEQVPSNAPRSGIAFDPLEAPRPGCGSQLRGTLLGYTGHGCIAGEPLQLCPCGWSLWEPDLGGFREPGAQFRLEHSLGFQGNHVNGLSVNRNISG